MMETVNEILCPVCQTVEPVQLTLARRIDFQSAHHTLWTLMPLCHHGAYFYSAAGVLLFVPGPMSVMKRYPPGWTWWDRDDMEVWDRLTEAPAQPPAAQWAPPPVALQCVCGEPVTASAPLQDDERHLHEVWAWTCATCGADGLVTTPGQGPWNGVGVRLEDGQFLEIPVSGGSPHWAAVQAWRDHEAERLASARAAWEEGWVDRATVHGPQPCSAPEGWTVDQAGRPAPRTANASEDKP